MPNIFTIQDYAKYKGKQVSQCVREVTCRVSLGEILRVGFVRIRSNGYTRKVGTYRFADSELIDFYAIKSECEKCIQSKELVLIEPAILLGLLSKINN